MARGCFSVRMGEGPAQGESLLAWSLSLERVTRIELALSAWEADVLPLNYTRERPSEYLAACCACQDPRSAAHLGGDSLDSAPCCCPTATSRLRSPRGGSVSSPTTRRSCSRPESTSGSTGSS